MADPLSIAGSIAGVISIGDVVFRKLYHYVKSVAKAEDEVMGLKNEVAALTGVLHNLRLVAQELEDDNAIRNSIRVDHVKSCLATLYKINALLSQIDISKGKPKLSVIQKLRWPLKSSETKELRGDVQRHCEVLRLALSADSMTALLQMLSTQKDIIGRLDKINQMLQTRERNELRITLDNHRKHILQAFFTVQPRDYLETILDLRHPTTGFWLVRNDTFQTWLRKPGSRLWLSGIPGAGKTVFSGLIVQESFARMATNSVVAYFYCDYKNQATLNIINLLSALAGQIAMKDESSFLLLQQFYADLHPRDQMERRPKAEELIKLIHEMSSRLDDVRIIVDGLDECEDHTRQAAEWLYKLVCCTSANISFVLLSRDEPEIRETLDNSSWSHIEITGHTEDIEHYVRSEIEQRIDDKRLRVRSDQLKDLIVEQLISKAQGMFRWVSCQLDHLCELATDSQRRRALNTLPETLNETYERILLRIKKPNIPLVVKALQWLVYGSPKLSTEALLDALSIDDGFEDLDLEARPTESELLSCCSSLIRRVGGNLELAHFTVQEFLQNLASDDRDLSQFQITPATIEVLATRCLNYLCSPVFDAPPPPSLEAFILFNEQHPFHAHAAVAWTAYMTNHWTQHSLMKLYGKLFDTRKTFNNMNYLINRLMDQDLSGIIESVETIYSEILRLIQSPDFRPIHAAAMLCLEPVVQWLVKRGCEVNVICPWGLPLELCCRTILNRNLKHIDVDAATATLTYLMRSGAESQSGGQTINTRVQRLLNDIGSSSNHSVAAKIADSVRSASLLSTVPAKSVWTDNEFHNMLKRSIKFDQVQHVERLMDDVRFSLQTKYQGFTIVDMAARSGALQVLRLLYRKHTAAITRVMNPSRKTSTPFHHSLKFGTESSCVFLLDIIDLKHEMLRDPAMIHLCVARGFVTLLRRLIVRGSNIEALANNGRSAWFYVTPWTTTEVYDLLLTSELDPLSSDNFGCIPLVALLDGNRSEPFAKHGLVPWPPHEGEFNGEMVKHLVTSASVQYKDPEGHSIWYHFCARYIPRICRSTKFLRSGGPQILGQQLVQLKALEAHEQISGSRNGLGLLIENVLALQSAEGIPRVFQERLSLLFVAMLDFENTIQPAAEDQMRALWTWTIQFDHKELFNVLLQWNIDTHVQCLPFIGASVVGVAAFTPRIAAKLGSHAKPTRLDELDEKGFAPIHYVCRTSNPKTLRSTRTQYLRLLLEAGADPNLEEAGSKRAPLHLAAVTNFPEGIELLLDHGADIHRRDVKGFNVCNLAVLNGSVRVLQYLDQHFADDPIWLNRVCVEISEDITNRDVSNLHLAVTNGNINVLKFLKSSGRLCDIDDITSNGWTSLHLAATVDRTGVMDWLINEGARLNLVTKMRGRTALHIAMQLGNLPAVRSLVKAGADYVKDSYGRTPQQLLPQGLIDDLVRTLEGLSMPGVTPHGPSASGDEQDLYNALDSNDANSYESIIHQSPHVHSADPTDRWICTLLVTALCSKQYDYFERLLSMEETTAGTVCTEHANPEAGVVPGFSSVHIATASSELNSHLDTLLDLSFQHHDHWSLQGVTPIHVASAFNSDALPILFNHVRNATEHLRHFVLHSATNWLNSEYPSEIPSWCPSSKSTPLHIAAFNDKLTSIEYLLNNNADINSLDEYGNTALHYATEKNRHGAAKMLLSCGADPNAQNHAEQTPLHYCAMYGSVEIIELLTSHGADMEMVDEENKTAICLAVKRDNEATAIALIEAGCDPTVVNPRGDSFLTMALSVPALRSYLLNRGFNWKYLAPPVMPHEADQDSMKMEATPWYSDCKGMLRAMSPSYRMVLLNSVMPWCQILMGEVLAGEVDYVRDLVRLGADVEHAARYRGSAIIVACRFNQLDVVKCLVYLGASLHSTMNGQPITAIVAARKFPKIVHWLLVGRYQEQLRLSDSTSDLGNVSFKCWSGIRELEVPLQGRFARRLGTSRLQHAVWIHKQKKRWREMVPLSWKPVLHA